MTVREQAEKDAARLLLTAWPGRLPVDPAVIARHLGIQVSETTLEQNISGALIKLVGRDPLIVLNESDSANRKRFTCAHEIGHFTRRSGQTEEEYQYVDLRSPLSATGMSEEEVYANNFAAALLMPEPNVKALVKDEVPVVEMALRFGVSKDAMQFRLINLGLA